jgi:hypothetical protein
MLVPVLSVYASIEQLPCQVNILPYRTVSKAVDAGIDGMAMLRPDSIGKFLPPARQSLPAIFPSGFCGRITAATGLKQSI